MNRVGLAGPRREHVARASSSTRCSASSRRSARSGATPSGPSATAAKRPGSAVPLERTWDGEWYRRGYYDDGAPLGAAQNDECRIDGIAAVLGRALRQPCRSVSPTAPWMRSARTSCGADIDLVALLTPPFDRSPQEPGYIKGYPPGVRENGGQYTHAAVWAVMALARLGYGDEAVELFHMLNPSTTRGRWPTSSATRPSHTSSPGTFSRTRHTPVGRAGPGTPARRAGCTAPASRASSASGVAARRFEIDPCIPASWPSCSIAWRFGATLYEIEVANPEGCCRGVAQAMLDGRPVASCDVPLVDDGRTHVLKVVLGVAPVGGASSGLADREGVGSVV